MSAKRVLDVIVRWTAKDDASRRSKDIADAIDDQAAKVTKAQTSMFASSFKFATGMTLGIAAATAFQQGLGFLKDALMEGVQAAAAFSLTLEQIAIMGGMESEIVALGEGIKSLAANSIYSLNEISDAYQTLATMTQLNVRDTNDYMRVINALSTVTGTDLNSSTQILIQTMQVFSEEMLSASEAADILAGAANVSAMSVYDIGVSLQYVGGSATMFNMTLEQTSGLLALLSNRGFVASTAGTSLNMAMQSLINPTREAENALSQLGIAVYDELGNTRNFIDIMEELSVATAGMTDQERNRYLTTIFGDRALRSVVALMDAQNDLVADGTGGLMAYTDALSDKIDVISKADEVMATWGGTMMQLQKQWELLKMSMGVAVIEGYVSVTDEATVSTKNISAADAQWMVLMTDLGKIIAHIMPLIEELILLILKVASILMEVLSPIIVMLIPILKVLTVGLDLVITFLNDLGAAAGFLIPIILLMAIHFGYLTAAAFPWIAIALAIIVLLQVLYEWFGKDIDKLIELILNFNICAAIANALSASIGWLFKIFHDLLMLFQDIIKAVTNVGAGFDWLKQQADGLGEAVGGVIKWGQDLLKVFDPPNCVLEVVMKNADAFDYLRQQMKDMSATATMTVIPVANQLMNSLQSPTLMDSMAGTVGEVAGGTNVVANTTITIQGDVKDEATVKSLEETITRTLRAMFTRS